MKLRLPLVESAAPASRAILRTVDFFLSCVGIIATEVDLDVRSHRSLWCWPQWLFAGALELYVTDLDLQSDARRLCVDEMRAVVFLEKRV